MYVGQLPTFHGPVLVLYLEDFEECCTEDIDSVRHYFWPTNICLLKFDMIVNLAKLDIGHLFTQGMRQWHLCTLDTFLVETYHNGVWL